MNQRLIGLFPQGIRAQRPRFFSALERAFGVTFEERDADDLARLQGAVVFGESSSVTDELWLRGISCLAVPGPRKAPTEWTNCTARLELAVSPLIHPALRGAHLNDGRAGRVPGLPVSAGDEILASRNGDPLWVTRLKGDASMDRAAVSPLEPPDGQPLRDQLRQGHFLSLLPLAHFLRGVTVEHAWSYPPVRATFVVDDPNLHWSSYGYLNYPTIVEDARRFGYHVAIGLVPLDGGFVRKEVTELFREAQSCLSVLVHGNDHSRRECGELRSDGLALAVIAQALRRVEAFERRSQVPVSRVMAAPHERCSEEAMRAMLRLGFEGICIDWRYPWRFRPGAEPMLAGFDQAELLAGGLPLMARDYLAASKEDLVFRAFLNQPLLLYGHHKDLCDGLDVLRAGAEEVNRLGDVKWCSLSSIARTNFSTRMEGGCLAVRMSSRRIIIDVPEGVDALRIETPVIHGGVDGSVLSVAGRPHRLASTDQSWSSEPLQTSPGKAEIRIDSRRSVDPVRVPAPPRRVWPLFRRTLGEGRDRLLPVADRWLRKSSSTTQVGTST